MPMRLFAAALLLATPLLSLRAQTPYQWTGKTGEPNWNDPGNWNPQEVPADDANATVFGDSGTEPLRVILLGADPRPYMYLSHFRVTSDAQADLSFETPRESILNGLTLEAGGRYTRVTFEGPAKDPELALLRISRGSHAAPLEWQIAAGKELVTVPGLAITGGRCRGIRKTGPGHWDFRGRAIGRPSELDESSSVSIFVEEGSFSLSRGIAQTVQIVSSEVEDRQPVLRIGTGAVLEMDLGPTSDRIDYVRAVARGETAPFQHDWLQVEPGAILKFHLHPGYPENEWVPLFTNVVAPENAFTVEGLPADRQAEFREVEARPGFRDFQVRIVPR